MTIEQIIEEEIFEIIPIVERSNNIDNVLNHLKCKLKFFEGIARRYEQEGYLSSYFYQIQKSISETRKQLGKLESSYSHQQVYH